VLVVKLRLELAKPRAGLDGGAMEIGKRKRVYVVEPIEDPVPSGDPAETDEPREPEPAPREREQVGS
jgi:hypothetical protein